MTTKSPGQESTISRLHDLINLCSQFDVASVLLSFGTAGRMVTLVIPKSYQRWVPLTGDPEMNERLRKRRTFADSALESVPALPALPLAPLRAHTAALLRSRLLQDCTAHAPVPTLLHHNLNNLAVSSFVRDFIIRTEQMRMLPYENTFSMYKTDQLNLSGELRESSYMHKSFGVREDLEGDREKSDRDLELESGKLSICEINSSPSGCHRQTSDGTSKNKISFSIDSIIGLK